MGVSVSLVITVYNRQSFLAATIESILAQTYGDFELVIWDDGSTEGLVPQDGKLERYTGSTFES